MKKDIETIDEYIRLFPGDVQGILKKLRQIARQVAPEATESISYQIPTFKLNGKPLIYFAAFTNHISLYPRTKGVDTSFKDEIKPYSKGKGTLQFPLNKPLPFDLIKRIISFRVKENN